MGVQVVAKSDGGTRPVRGSGAYSLLTSASATAAFTTTAYEVLDQPWVAGYAFATSATGTNPTITVAFQDAPVTDSAAWVNVGTVTLTSATLSAKLSFPTGVGRYVRATASLAGTNPTFSAFKVYIIAKN